MATITAENPTLADVASRMDPDSSISTVIELLTRNDEILEDLTFMEGNLPTGHKSTVRTGLPSVTWRLLNYGVDPSKSRTAQVTDTAGMLEAYAQVDKKLAELSGNVAQFRMTEESAFRQALKQEVVNTLFYGNTTTNPEKFMGLLQRYNDMSAENAENIVDADPDNNGSGADNTSIWLINWAPDKCHMFYPKGTQAGLVMEDLGQETVTDANGGLYEAYRTHYEWNVGLTLRDWRYVVRVCNIDTSLLNTMGSGYANLIRVMGEALETIESTSGGRLAFYCNRTVRKGLRKQVNEKANVNLTLDDFGGKRILNYDGVPIRLCEGILDTEEHVA